MDCPAHVFRTKAAGQDAGQLTRQFPCLAPFPAQPCPARNTPSPAFDKIRRSPVVGGPGKNRFYFGKQSLDYAYSRRLQRLNHFGRFAPVQLDAVQAAKFGLFYDLDKRLVYKNPYFPDLLRKTLAYFP